MADVFLISVGFLGSNNTFCNAILNVKCDLVNHIEVSKRNRSRILGFLPIEFLVGDFENE